MSTTENKTAVFVTNLGKYNEGMLVGEWLPLPADADEIEACLERIGINEYYEEYFITDYEDYTELGLYDMFGEYSSIERISEVVEKYDNIPEYEREAVQTLVNDCGYDLDDAIEKVNNGEVIFWEGDTMADVAYNMINELGEIDSIPEWAQPYFDYEAYGRNLETGGEFHACGSGYIEVLR